MSKNIETKPSLELDKKALEMGIVSFKTPHPGFEIVPLPPYAQNTSPDEIVPLPYFAIQNFAIQKESAQ